VLERMGTAGVIKYFGSNDEITVHDGRFIIQMDYVETSDSATPAGNCDIRKVELDAPYQIKVSESLTRT
jgi:hypothetical protein